MTAPDYESYADRVGYEWGFHSVPCSCGETARLQLNHDQAAVSCEACGHFKVHRRRYGWGPKRQPTGGTPKRVLDQMDKIWCRTVPIKNTIGEEIFNLTVRKLLGATHDANYCIDDLEGIFRFYPTNRSVCALMADKNSGDICGLIELFISHSGFVFYEKVTGTRGKIWPSLELLTRDSIGPPTGNKNE